MQTHDRDIDVPVPPAMPEAPAAPQQPKKSPIKKIVLAVVGGFLAIGMIGAISGPKDTPAPVVASPAAVVPSTAPASPAPVDTYTPPAPAPGETYQDPIKFGDLGVGGGWKIEVVGFQQNATGAVMAENMFNDHPRAGNTIALVTLKVTRTQGAGDPYFGLNWQMVSAQGEQFKEYDWNVLPNDLIDVGRLPAGISGTGTIAFEVPNGAKVGAVYISGAFFAVK